MQTGTGGTDADPFAAIGLRIGSFTLRPELEIGLSGKRETTTSVNGTPAVAKQSTAYSLLADSSLRLQLNSDWARHALNVMAAGSLQRTVADGDTLEPEGQIDASGRLDIGAGTTLSGAIGYAYQLDDPDSAAFYAATDPSLVPAVDGVNRPPTQTLTASLALRQDVGRLFGEAELSASRSIYGAAKLSDGSTISQADRNNTVYDARLRAGIEASPVFSPFAEVGYGSRRMDLTPDSGGADRNSIRSEARIGTGIDFGEKLSGEVSAGYIREDIADPALSDIAGIAVDASFTWSPRRETDVSFGLSTSTQTSGSAGEAGALLYAANLGVTHRIRADLTAQANFGAEYSDANGGADEATLTAEAGMTYWFNRFAGLTTRISHEEVLSSDPSNRSRTTTAFMGLRLQR